MHKTKKKVFEEIKAERYYCERRFILGDHLCDGRLTMEHALTYSGKQIPDKWAIVVLCEWAHGVGKYAQGGGLNKRINEWLALMHASPEDLEKYPKKDWVQMKKYLDKIIEKTKDLNIMKGLHKFIEKRLGDGSIEVTCEKCDYHTIFDNQISAEMRNIYGCKN